MICAPAYCKDKEAASAEVWVAAHSQLNGREGFCDNLLTPGKSSTGSRSRTLTNMKLLQGLGGEGLPRGWLQATVTVQATQIEPFKNLFGGGTSVGD